MDLCTNLLYAVHDIKQYKGATVYVKYLVNNDALKWVEFLFG